MDRSRIQRAAEEAGTLKRDDMRDQGRAQIVAPTVTRRPVLDTQLASIAAIASAELERMRLKSMNDRHGLSAEDMRAFKNLAETTIRQARVEMEVENHVQARASALSKDQVREKLIRAMNQERIDVRVQGVVLRVLGMPP